MRTPHTVSLVRRVPLAAAALFCAWPTVALACPVCFDPREENRLAFLLTTVFLTLLPLALMGGTVYWLWRRYKQGAAELVAADEVSGA